MITRAGMINFSVLIESVNNQNSLAAGCFYLHDIHRQIPNRQAYQTRWTSLNLFELLDP